MPEDKIQRRNFLKQSAVLSTGFLLSRMPVIAGPFMPGELNAGHIPENKKLDPEWVKSLYNRGRQTVYLKSKNELNFIGMPVGGINCGTVYLGGDGRLWLWDIFNKNQEGVDPKTIQLPGEGNPRTIRSRDGSAYVEPARDIRPLQQGFLVHIKYSGITITRRLEAADWEEISFEAGYPVATIRYSDRELPIAISMEVYTPFIPLDEYNSGLPATILSLTIENRSAMPVTVTITGFLENITAVSSAKPGIHRRVNAAVSTRGLNAVLLNTEDLAGSMNISDAADFGSMCLACLNRGALVHTDFTAAKVHGMALKNTVTTARKPVGETLLGAVSVTKTLKAGKSVTTDFLISWYFPNLAIKGLKDKGRYYMNHFKDAAEVAVYISKTFRRLSSQTKLFRQTWYDSSLPYWFLERTIYNVSTLATTTCHRFESGRFYGWEGVGCCPGTCTHVWHYAQAVARIFPALERDTRSRVDLGTSLEENGGIIFRGEFEKRPAIDGQAGTILRIYREHQMSTDNTFLATNWPKIRKAVQFIINQDKNQDGMEDIPMENTLDAVWDGEIAWIVGLCIAAVSAGREMAVEMKDDGFEKLCKEYIAKGSLNMESTLFNGEYFIHRPDPEKGRAKLGSYNTCHIDQVLGQSWAFQVGLPRIINKEKTLSALKSLWKYNFSPDVGPYIKTHPGGRPYALAGEGGMIMNTNPKNEEKAYGDNVTWQLGYFHECMSGFEHQVASHMMAEGMTDEALILTRMIHDRYHASKRNPFNEIECSDHYARAMASYGTFITACGFRYHGPRGHVGFVPAWNAEDFKSAFIAAEGWGTYSQQKKENKQVHTIMLRVGQLQLKSLSFQKLGASSVTRVTSSLKGRPVACKFSVEDGTVSIELDRKLKIAVNEELVVEINQA